MDFEEQIKRLKELVKKLKSNEEKVSKEELLTKYRKAYDNLRNEVKESADNLIDEILMEGLLIVQDEKGYKYLEDMNKLIEGKKAEGIDSKYGLCLYRDYDVDKMVEMARKVKVELDETYNNYLKEDGRPK